MRAILIDSRNKEIKEVSIMKDSSILDQWYSLLDCEMVESAFYLENGVDSVLVDEEGMLSIDENSTFFTYPGTFQPFAGNGLVTGVDEDGDTVSCTADIEEIQRDVQFHTYNEVKSTLLKLGII